MATENLGCEAFIDWPDGRTLCGRVALYLMDRLDDTRLSTCAEHLGPVLQHGDNVIWPPKIEWLGEGQRPAVAKTPV